MTRKGVYPYEYIDDWKKFEETSLPPKDAFYSRLSMKGISDHDYVHAQQVWNTMEKKTLGCYHDTYLKTDVLLLADVFETFRDTCLKNYKLDPAHFYTAPGLAWQAFLKTAAEYCEHVNGNTSFIKPFKTLYNSIARNCKLRSCTETVLSFSRSSSKVDWLSLYTILRHLSYSLLILLFINRL